MPARYCAQKRLKMATHVYTSFSYSYLNRARVLAHSIRKHHPDWVIWAVLTDKNPPGFVLDWNAEEFDRVVTPDMLFGEETERWLFGHDIVEACTAVKGQSLRMILRDPTAELVIYLDPDIALFNPLTPVIEKLATHSIALTPHQLQPDLRADTQAIIDNEITSLAYGAYNLGFLAVRNDPEANRYASWWAERLHDWCHDRRDMGLFVDQKWCDLVPCLFDGVGIIRDPGCNVASWNLSQRKMHFSKDGTALINGSPLRFYHFTKLGPIGDTMTRRYARDNFEIHELWWWYRKQVQAFTDTRIPKGWWHYGQFDNGLPIKKSVRELYRSRTDLQSAFPYPRGIGEGSFLRWLEMSSIDH